MTDRTIGVLLGQVGTPEEPTRRSVRAYLAKFLSDPRVIDLHPLIWKPILYGLVLPWRSGRSARMYQEIWTKDGSPLRVYSQKMVEGLQERLGDEFAVKLGMAYSSPSIQESVGELEKQKVDELIVLPLFPQFSTATTASIIDEAYAAISGRSWITTHIHKKEIPPFRFVGPFYDRPDYVRLLAAHIRKQLALLPEPPDKYILSFHGLPKRYVEKGDPYQNHCDATAELLAKEMSWKKDEWMQVYQSRFGREEWLEPYAEPTIRGLSAKGIERPCIIPLSFVTDCLETLHELGILYRKVFAEGGGDPEKYFVMPCLNAELEWLDFLATLINK